MILTLILISIVAVLFAFPLYWIITGSFKTGAAINATTPEWWPSQWVLTNYQKTFAGKSRTPVAAGRALQPLFQRGWRADLFLRRPDCSGRPALDDQHRVHGRHVHDPHLHHRRHGRFMRWPRSAFVGRKLLFTLIVCAMALPKQVILIPLLREMSALNLYNTIWAVIFPHRGLALRRVPDEAVQ